MSLESRSNRYDPIEDTETSGCPLGNDCHCQFQPFDPTIEDTETE